MSLNNITFCVSQDLDVPLKVKIKSLEGHKPLLKPSQKILNPELMLIGSNVFPSSDLIVSLQVFDKERNRNLTLPIYTPYIPFRNSRTWDYWLTLPIRIKQLTFSSHLRIILWEYNGSKQIPFFNLETSIFNLKDCTLKRGFESLKFRYDVIDHCEVVTDNKDQENLNKYFQGEFTRLPWLDEITISKLRKQRENRTWPQGTFVLNLSLIHI